MTKLANYLENKIWYMLLFTVAVIPLEQEFRLKIILALFAHRARRGSRL